MCLVQKSAVLRRALGIRNMLHIHCCSITTTVNYHTNELKNLKSSFDNAQSRKKAFLICKKVLLLLLLL